MIKYKVQEYFLYPQLDIHYKQVPFIGTGARGNINEI